MNAVPESDIRLSTRLPFVAHGAVELPDVRVESYSLIFREKGKFVGDKVNKGAFIRRIDELRKEARRKGKDPFGEKPSTDIRKGEWSAVFAQGDSAAHTLVNIAIEDFSAALFDTIQKYRSSDDGWRKVEGIAVGGGFSEGRIGKLVIARTQKLLHDKSVNCQITPIKLHPDEAGIIGTAYLSPAWIFSGFDGFLGVDIGGTNIRCGAVLGKTDATKNFKKLKIDFTELWRHADDDPNRTETVSELVGMLQRIVRKCSKAGLSLAPYIGVGCPGRIRPDGTIDRGAQNLPGKWEGENFNLPALLKERVKIRKKHETVVVMHNDAVAQGLSEIPRMKKFAHWGILTIGTGLGNAKFTTVGVGTGKNGRKR